MALLISIKSPKYTDHSIPKTYVAATDTVLDGDEVDHEAFLSGVQPGDLIELVCPMERVSSLSSNLQLIEKEEKQDCRTSFYIEVRRCRRNRGIVVCEGICEGELIHIEAAGHKLTTIKHLGHWPRLSEAWVKGNPCLQKVLKDIRKKQIDTNTLPSHIMNDNKHCTVRLQRMSSLAEFRALVSSDPSYWCDGVGPDDEQPSPFQIAMQTTGELLALMDGARGVSLVQLDVGVDLGSVRIPLLRPFVLQCLQEASSMKGVCVFSSILGTNTASSMVLALKIQPFQSWGRHLAKLGVQAAIVADSPYYKYLIGLILGYKEANIIHHITSKGQRVEDSVLSAARQELASLNPTPPRLPKRKELS